MKTIKRHSMADRLIHWSNAILWILLFFTGMGLVDNPKLNLFGAWYPEFLRSLAGSGAALLKCHIYIGALWLIAFLAYIITNFKAVLFFLKEVFSFRKEDFTWIVRKPFLMAFGTKTCKKWGLNTELPPQGFYNMGQKLFGILCVISCILLAGTGVILAFAAFNDFPVATFLIGWSISLHFLFAGLTFAGLFIHIYMAALIKAERPGFFSMFTGNVSAEYAEHHHKIWFQTNK